MGKYCRVVYDLGAVVSRFYKFFNRAVQLEDLEGSHRNFYEYSGNWIKMYCSV